VFAQKLSTCNLAIQKDFSLNNNYFFARNINVTNRMICDIYADLISSKA